MSRRSRGLRGRGDTDRKCTGGLHPPPASTTCDHVSAHNGAFRTCAGRKEASLGYLLPVDCSSKEGQRLCVSTRVWSGGRRGSETLASRRSSLPSCKAASHRFVRKGITLMTACPVSDTADYCAPETRVPFFSVRFREPGEEMCLILG